MIRALATVWHDLRFGLRQVRARPVFAVGVVISLGLGTGATTIAYSWVDAIVLRPPPGVSELSTLLTIRGSGQGGLFVSVPELEDWRREATTVAGVAAESPYAFAVSVDTGRSVARPRFGVVVTRNYFEVLGVKPILGRTFPLTDDEFAGVPTEVVIGHAVWQEQYGGNPAVLGAILMINERAFEIVGVLPKGFGGTLTGVRFEMFLPLNALPVVSPGAAASWRDRSNRWLDGVARLRPGVTREAADAEFRVIGERQAVEYAEHRNRQIRASALDVGWARNLSPLLWTVTTASALLLLIVCANVANLLLVRASARAREFGIRVSLGASRARLLRQLTTESAVLGLFGSALGLGITASAPLWSGGLFPSTAVPLALDLGVNARVLAFAVAVTVATTLAFGLAPAVLASRAGVIQTMKQGSAGSAPARSRARDALVIGQFALCLTVMVSTVLFGGLARRMSTYERGFGDAARVLLMQTDMSFAGIEDVLEWERVVRSAELEITRVPGVDSAAVATFVPLGFLGYSRSEMTVGGYEPKPGESLRVMSSAVGPGYFDLMRIRVLDGRPIEAGDDGTSAPIAVVNERFEREYGGGGSIIGRPITVDGRAATVVGVVANGKYDHRAIDDPSPPFVYVAFRQAPRRTVTFHVRTRGDPMRLVEPVRAAIQQARPALPLLPPSSLEEYASAPLSPFRKGVAVLAGLGVAALLVATTGLYSVIAYATALRQRETSIRMAIGASPLRVVREILFEASVLASSGLVAGIVCAVCGGRLMAHLLPVMPDLTVGDVAAPGFVLATAALLAAAAPALRASRADIARSLRSE